MQSGIYIENLILGACFRLESSDWRSIHLGWKFDTIFWEVVGFKYLIADKFIEDILGFTYQITLRINYAMCDYYPDLKRQAETFGSYNLE